MLQRAAAAGSARTRPSPARPARTVGSWLSWLLLAAGALSQRLARAGAELGIGACAIGGVGRQALEQGSDALGSLVGHGREIAGLFIEPLMQGAAGMWPQPASFVRRVRELCDAHEVLLVCDEVATGWWETARLQNPNEPGAAPS